MKLKFSVFKLSVHDQIIYSSVMQSTQKEIRKSCVKVDLSDAAFCANATIFG